MKIQLEYPFAPITLAPADYAIVEGELAIAERAHRLYPTRPELGPLVAIFLKHCSPRAPSAESLQAMTRFLHVVMYFADRVNEKTIAADAPPVWRLMMRAGEAPTNHITQAANEAGIAIREVTNRVGGDLTSVAHRLKTNLNVFVWLATHRAHRYTLDDYLDLRTQTICVLAWERLWGVLNGLRPESEIEFAFTLERLERLSAIACALANDLRSVGRDQRDQMPNAVLLLAGERRIELGAAVDETRRHHDQVCARLRDGIDAAHHEAGPHRTDLRDYLEFIGACTLGNHTSMDDLAARYD